MKKVSILIPCYNAGKFVHEAVTSALYQDYPEKEIIVIDDGSTDDSVAILRSFGDKIKLISRENRGGNPTRNELLKNATGEWIQYLDADDFLSKGKVSEQMQWIDTNSGFDVVYGPTTLAYDNGMEKRFERQEVIYPNDEWAALVSWELPQTSSPLFRRTALEEVGGWNDQQKVCQEHELYFRLLKSGKKFIGLPGIINTTNYRLWGNSTISKRNPEKTYLTRMSIMEQAYSYMKQNGLLTDARRETYMDWSLLVSRGLWQLNRKEAEAFYARNKNAYPLSQVRSRHLTSHFKKLVQYFGYPVAERIASLLRTSVQELKNRWSKIK